MVNTLTYSTIEHVCSGEQDKFKRCAAVKGYGLPITTRLTSPVNRSLSLHSTRTLGRAFL